MMGDTWIIDIRHFGTDQASLMDIPVRARRLAEYFGAVISAATLATPGVIVNTALQCRRRPGRKPCPGHLIVEPYEVPPEIQWSCSDCNDNGVIRNWKGTAWDLSERGANAAGDEAQYSVLINREEYRALRKGGVAFDLYCDRIIYGAETLVSGIEVTGNYDDLDYFLDCLAAEANHETNRGRRKLLESVYDRIQAELLKAEL